MERAQRIHHIREFLSGWTRTSHYVFQWGTLRDATAHSLGMPSCEQLWAHVSVWQAAPLQSWMLDSLHVWKYFNLDAESEWWWWVFEASQCAQRIAALIGNEEGRVGLWGAACYFRWESDDQRLFSLLIVDSVFLPVCFCLTWGVLGSPLPCPHPSKNAENLSKARKLPGQRHNKHQRTSGDKVVSSWSNWTHCKDYSQQPTSIYVLHLCEIK